MAIEQFGEGEVVTETSDDVKRLPCPPTEKFVYAHTDERWTYVENTGWRPQLQTIIQAVGVNGVRGKKGKRNAKAAITAQLSRGGKVFLPSDKSLGPYRNYIRAYPTVFGRNRHCTQFERPTVIGNKVHWKTDEAGYWAFCQYLVDKGLIEPMAPEVFQELMERHDAQIDNVEERAIKQPGLNGRLEQLKKRRAEMVADYERQFGPLEVEPEVVIEEPEDEPEPPKKTATKKRRGGAKR